MTGTTQQTQELIERAARGDETARRDLLEGYRDRLRRMVASRLDRRVAARLDASDIVQDALADAARQMDRYLANQTLTFFGWLRFLASEHVRDAHGRHLFAGCRTVHRESRTPEFNDESAAGLARQFVAHDTSPSNRLMRKERCQQVTDALASLPPEDRELLAMRFVEQLSLAEIAEAVGTTLGAVKKRQLRAIIRLRSLLEEGS